MSSPILLILGAGKNVGSSVAQLFSQNGYKVALASRTGTSPSAPSNSLQIKADFSDPSSIGTVFKEVKEKLGTPNVVVYNAASVHFASGSPVSTTLSDFSTSVAINITSTYAALQGTISGFETLPKDATKTFIYTGNGLNVKPMPALLDLGVGKSASAHMVEALSTAFEGKGYQFYYADERKADGAVVGGAINGQNHAEFFHELVKKKEQGPWDATFVGGKGYVDFGAK